MGADVFISHSSLDKKYATWLKAYLEANGVSCWMDSTDIHGGKIYYKEIPDAIHDCKFLVLLLSEHAQKSEWVADELHYALNNGKTVLPFMLENCPLNRDFDFLVGRFQRFDAYKDMRSAAERMLRIIQLESGKTDYTIDYEAQADLQKQMQKLQKGLNTTARKPAETTAGIKKGLHYIVQAILWIAFFPIMLIIKICKSRQLHIIAKVVLVAFVFPFITIWLMIYISLFSRQADTGGKSYASKDQIEIDVIEMVTPFISGYNNYGYFDSTMRSEGLVKASEHTFSYQIEFAEFQNGDAYFKLSVDKDAAPLGDAYIAARCNALLSNDEILEFAVTDQIDGCKIILNNSKFRISTLKTGTFERNDPKEYFVLNQSRTSSNGVWVDGVWGFYWYQFETSEAEYPLGTKTVKVSVIEDKRPGAAFVQPGICFEVYENNELLGQGRYVFSEKSGLHYNADNDDYGECYYLELIADFNQAELLDKTGILFNLESRSYKGFD